MSDRSKRCYIHTYIHSAMLIIEDPTVQCRTAINALFFYFDLSLSVTLDILSCSFRGKSVNFDHPSTKLYTLTLK